MAAKALYIGAGLHLEIIKVLKHIKEFIFVDSQPFSEFGKKTYFYIEDGPLTNCIPCFSKKKNGFERPHFLSNLKKVSFDLNIEIIEEKKDIIVFQYNDQKITYCYNTSIPEDLSKIEPFINNFNNLILIGHDPFNDFLKYSAKNVIFWDNTHTCYFTPYSKDDKFEKLDKENEKIIYNLNYYKEFRNKFLSFNIIDSNNNVFVFNEWNNFLHFKSKKSIN
tara:strand:- start:142 stop:804 length:663 start_codon:yes stop_codon:yes gene_type:complete